VSKRHELLRRGWPARTLLLSEVVVSSGEHHLVLVIRTRNGDLVLDNLTPQVKPWSRTRVQMPSHDRLWATIGGKGRDLTMCSEEIAANLNGNTTMAVSAP
jgi:predicted transglutaminase-like cysteine proteinase